MSYDRFERHGRIGRFIHRLLCKVGLHYWSIGWIPFTKVVECDICGTQKDFKNASVANPSPLNREAEGN